MRQTSRLVQLGVAPPPDRARPEQRRRLVGEGVREVPKHVLHRVGLRSERRQQLARRRRKLRADLWDHGEGEPQARQLPGPGLQEAHPRGGPLEVRPA